MDSHSMIINDVKRLLSIDSDTSEYDLDIISHVNSAFFTLFSLGIGPSTPFSVDSSTTWDEFSSNVPSNVLLDYVYLKVALVFDPPSSSAVIDAYKDRIAELEFRMNILVDNGGGYVTG